MYDAASESVVGTVILTVFALPVVLRESVPEFVFARTVTVPVPYAARPRSTFASPEPSDVPSRIGAVEVAAVASPPVAAFVI